MHFVEDEVFKLGTEIGLIADAGATEIGLRFLGDMARIPTIGLAGDRIGNVADQDEGRRFRERVPKRRGRIGMDQHVAFLDLLESPDRRAVEADPVGEAAGVEGSRRHGKVLPEARNVGEAKIDHFDRFVPDDLEYVVGSGAVVRHRLFPPRAV